MSSWLNLTQATLKPGVLVKVTTDFDVIAGTILAFDAVSNLVAIDSPERGTVCVLSTTAIKFEVVQMTAECRIDELTD
jgi:small nuclear ribonucleoprotein (snRNP)-like protein